MRSCFAVSQPRSRHSSHNHNRDPIRDRHETCTNIGPRVHAHAQTFSDLINVSVGPSVCLMRPLSASIEERNNRRTVYRPTCMTDDFNYRFQDHRGQKVKHVTSAYDAPHADRPAILSSGFILMQFRDLRTLTPICI